jgi:N-methylhydantoinase A
MAGAIRLVSIERGFDPKRFAFMPFGGGGALHTGAMLAETGIAGAIVPRYPGVTSAMGCVIADMRQDFVQTVNRPVDALDVDGLRATMQAHVEAGLGMLDAARTRFEARETVFELDMAYLGQTHTVSVPLAVPVEGGRVGELTFEAIERAFDAAYRATYGRLLDGGVRRLINLRTSVTGRRPKFDLSTLAPKGGSTEPVATRPVHFGAAWHETAIYDRLSLPVGARIAGPAILVQPDTTVLVDPGLVATVDIYGNTIVAPEGTPE